MDTSALAATFSKSSRATTPLLRQAITRARKHLLALQKPDGHWVGELQGDTILESEWMLLLAFLGLENSEKFQKAARYLLAQQQEDGGWNNYPGGPSDVSVSTKAYFALKLAGVAADSPALSRARECILGLGGAAACNSFTKFYLALLGQFPYENCPAVPPEMMLLPRWAYLNIYAMSAWTRTIVVPLTIFYAHKPVKQLPEQLGIRELFLASPKKQLWPHPPTKRWFTWTNLFLGLDYLVKQVDRYQLSPVRARALRQAEAWLREHLVDSDGLGAIFPPMIYTVISLHCLGHGLDSPDMQWALKQLDDLILADEESDSLRLQPCVSPVWDTALTLNALADAGDTNEDLEVAEALDWLLDREIRAPGDWSLHAPQVEPAGWVFEYRNRFYPDTDDTSMVLMALAKTRHIYTEAGQAAAQRAIRWLLYMQNDDGGWAAFDRNINKQILERVPFADHNAMLDPSCPDITARVLESLGYFGYFVGHPQVDRAVQFVLKHQERFGGWVGRWGVNYIYGTWQVLQGLRKVGYSMQQPAMQKAVAWLKHVQQPSGAWGETCRSYDEPKLAGKGEPTASQTAWALLGLLAAGEAKSEAVQQGIAWLLETQKSDGSWDEVPFTGTGFPKVFYLKYHMYRLYFPLMALARYATACSPTSATTRARRLS